MAGGVVCVKQRMINICGIACCMSNRVFFEGVAYSNIVVTLAVTQIFGNNLRAYGTLN